MSELHQLRDAVRLGEELRELESRLNQAVQDSVGGNFPDELLAEFEKKAELFSAAVAQAYPSRRERTAEEAKLMEFADRLAARQGTFMPDFNALAKQKAELDRRLLDP